MYRRFWVCGEGGRLESLTGHDLTGSRWSGTQVAENCLHAIGTSAAPSVHLLCRRFSLGTILSPLFLAFNRPNTLIPVFPVPNAAASTGLVAAIIRHQADNQ